MARTKAPWFEDKAVFANVDMSECLLVGNDVGNEKMTFLNVQWHHDGSRWMLYDERRFHECGLPPVHNLLETYQVLKERYARAGDHVRSGDFHYGEMEMKRWEYGERWMRALRARRPLRPSRLSTLLEAALARAGVPALGRVMCLEYLYWAASGYGTRWIRALLVLVGLIVGCATAYWFTPCSAFPSGFQEALRFSLGVTALQRPDVPKEFGSVPRWLHTAQAILGPVQIALFVLALRMRLRR